MRISKYLVALAAIIGAFTCAANEYVDGVADRLSAYIRVDTTNPPGNETRGVEFIGAILEEAGIEFETAESAPGRGNLWARLDGGRRPGLILLHHIDVVPANAEYWSVPPYSGERKDGYLWGRGALDMKALGIAQLQAFLALHASGEKLKRDVMYVATADEEAGGFFGAGWLIENRPEIFKGMGYVINEGGGGRLMGEDLVFTVEVTQKVPVWLRLIARGNPGHGSQPQAHTAVTRLLRAGNRLAETRFVPEVIAPVAELFSGTAEYQEERFRDEFADIAAHVGNAAFMQELQLANPGAHALLRNTCSLTTLTGSQKINVVPPEATLELDCRVLPTQDVDAFIQEISLIVNDPDIEIERIMNFTPAVSGTDTELFELIRTSTAEAYPGSKVVPGVTTGFTDSHFFRDAGIDSYGFAPFVIGPEEGRGVHGNDERISIEALEEGTSFLIDFLRAFAVD